MDHSATASEHYSTRQSSRCSDAGGTEFPPEKDGSVHRQEHISTPPDIPFRHWPAATVGVRLPPGPGEWLSILPATVPRCPLAARPVWDGAVAGWNRRAPNALRRNPDAAGSLVRNPAPPASRSARR